MPQLEKSTIKERARQLREASTGKLCNFLDRHVGTQQMALIESVDDQGGAKGRLSNFAELTITGSTSMCAGIILPVDITGRDGTRLNAQLHDSNGTVR